MSSDEHTTEIKKTTETDAIRALFDGQESFILLGYETGINSYSTIPAIFNTADDLNKLVVNHFCNHNLVTYLLDAIKIYLNTDKDLPKKINILVKPCDGKTLVELIREKQIERENIHIISLPCRGMLDIKKIEKLKNRPTELIQKITIENNQVIIQLNDREVIKKLQDVVENKCLTCKLQQAPIYDETLGETIPPTQETLTTEPNTQLSSEALRKHWLKEYERCIRCGACRNVCPLCYCKNCVLDSMLPEWISKEPCAADNGSFLMIRAMHLAGRCIGCGQCTSVCPVGINHKALHHPLWEYVKNTFDFNPGESNDRASVFSEAKMEEKKDFPNKVEE